MKPFVHLHNHTEYSLLDGAARIKKLVKTAIEHGSPAVAITDHGNMYGTYKFYKAVKEANKENGTNLKAIIGCEIYIVDDLKAKHPKEHRGHLVLLAKNNKGYINLCKINSKAWTEGFYFKPRIDYKFLAEHSDGLVCLSACLAGHIPYYLQKNMYDEAKKYAELLKNCFGSDFYLELQDHGLPEQKLVNPGIIQLSRDLSVELVVTNDVHYIYAEDAEMQDALMCVEMRKTIDDPDRMKFSTDQFYLKTHDEMSLLFPDLPEAVTNTLAIADKCDCHPFTKGDLIPQFTTPNGEDNVEYFRAKIEKGLIERYGSLTPEVMERYEKEFKVIHENKFVDYFLIVADFMAFANDNGIAVGPGRGSGAGSIIAYALNITKLDPLKYQLLFERFLHSERVSMPDFDLDFCCNRRGEVIDYVIDKYGENRVCQIVTFGTLAAKAAVKDIARVFRMPYSEVDSITKPMNFGQAVRPPLLPYVFDLKKLKNPREESDFDTKDNKTKEKLLDAYNKERRKLEELRTPELVNLYKNNAEVKKIVDMALKVEGFPRNCSTHAAGVIICKKVVGDVTPLQRNGTDITSQFDMKEVEELGMLKMDFLGLITLTDIQGAIFDIKAKLGIDIDFYKMEYNDQDVYKMISSGDTDAVFQLESGGFKKFMKELKPDCIEDIIAGVALFRPGPIDMIPDYCRNKHNPALTTFDHPMLEPILKNTYGIIIYQEQVMDVFRVLGGYNLGQADMVRRAMGKKDHKEMDRQKDIFLYGDEKTNICGAVKNGVDKETAIKIYDKMSKFASYAFNKSHAACYAFVAYQTAYLKHYYYPFYLASVLNQRVNKWDDMTHYIVSIRSHGVDVLPPSINKSSSFFSVELRNPETDDLATRIAGAGIRFGLAALKNVGAAIIELILKERAENGPFVSFQDFCKRVDGTALNKRCLESLILSGAFDELGSNRSALMTAYPAIVKVVSGDKKAADSGQISMFDLLPPAAETEIQLPNMEEYDEFTKLKLEKECVGIYLSGHPLQQYAKMFEEYNFSTRLIRRNKSEGEEDIEPAETEEGEGEISNNMPVTMGAIVVDIKKVLTKATKKEMAVLRVEDMYGACEVMLFPQVYDKTKKILGPDVIVKVTGKLSIREGEDAIILADNVELLVEAPKTDAEVKAGATLRPVENKLYLRYNTADTELQSEVMSILTAYSGDMAVVIKCTATNQALAPAQKVRDCRAVIYELSNVLGEENVKVV